MIKIFTSMLAGIYIVGFVAIFLLEATVGPVTLPLAFVRAVAWPVYITTGHPEDHKCTFNRGI